MHISYGSNFKKPAIYFCKISSIAIHCEYYIFEYWDLVFSLKSADLAGSWCTCRGGWSFKACFKIPLIVIKPSLLLKALPFVASTGCARYSSKYLHSGLMEFKCVVLGIVYFAASQQLLLSSISWFFSLCKCRLIFIKVSGIPLKQEGRSRGTIF